jgi:CzcA family heavy metal efflux pump
VGGRAGGAGARLFDVISAHASLVAIVAVALMGGGLAAVFSLPSGIYPELDFPRIVVVARSGDEPPPVVQATMARPIEEALATIPGVQRIRTRMIRGASETSLQFDETTDMRRAEQLAQSAVTSVKDALPPGAEVEVARITPADFPVLSFDLVGGTGLSRLEVADTLVRPALARVPGVGEVSIVGGDVREVGVLADPERLASLHMRPSELADIVRDALVRRSVGRIEDLRQAVTVMAESEAVDVATLARMPIAMGAAGPVTLGDVARVEERPADRAWSVHAPEGDCVQVAVSRRIGASTPDLVAAVDAVVAKLALPEGMRLVEVYDQGKLIAESVTGIRDAIIIGILLTIGVLALFLRQLRSGALAALSVPFALIATFLAMRLLGQTLNLMSLGGMAIAIGIVIDDAIVVIEAVVRHLETGKSPRDAARAGLDEMMGPIIGTTVTVIVVLLPLTFLSGVTGSFFKALAITLASAVLMSHLFALVLIPLLAAKVLRPVPARTERRRSPLLSRHAAAVRWLLARRGLALASIAVLAVAGLLASRHLASGFLPEMDEGAFVVDYFLPAGSSLSDTEVAALRVEAVIGATPGIVTWSRRTGAELGPITATETNHGDIVVLLAPRRERESSEQIQDRIRTRLANEVPGVRVEFVQVLEDVLNDLAGNPRPLEVRILGKDQDVLARLAGEVEQRLADVPGLVDYYAGVEAQAPVLRHVIDSDAATRAGLSPADIASDLDVAVGGEIVGDVPRLDRLVPVRVRLDDRTHLSASAVASVPIAVAAGLIPLGVLAPAHVDTTAAALFRDDLSPAAIASADVEGEDLGGVVNEVTARLKDLRVPAGHRVEVGGRVESQRRAFRQLAVTFATGLTCVLAVLVAQLRSLRAALLVLVSVPTALVGVAVILAVTGTALNVSSLMGVVLLAGLVVKNGILLLQDALKRARAGMPVGAALVAAGRRRIRPILMTTLCTIFGLLPLALAIGAGSELQRPLAIAVIGGLLTSTLATLFVVPALARMVLPRHLKPL